MERRALSGLRVVEYGRLVSAPYCAKLLGDMGADVIKVEPPTGDPARQLPPFPHDEPNPEGSGLFSYLNTNKRSVTLDLQQTAGRRLFRELLGRADILITNAPPAEQDRLGITYEALASLCPRLIVVSVTPFGRAGLYRDFKATDLIAAMLSGIGYYCPGTVEHPEEEPPLKPGGRLLSFIAAVNAAVATMGAVFLRMATGEGQQVDVSEQEAAMDTIRLPIAYFTYAYELQSRLPGERSGVLMIPYWPCKDGYVRGIPPFPLDEARWNMFLDVMGNPSWAADERFKDQESRTDHWEELVPLIEAWSMQHTKEEIADAMQDRHVVCMPVNDMEDIASSQQLNARGYFVDIEHPVLGKMRYPGAPYRFTGTPWGITRPAPRLGQHNQEVLCRELGYSIEELAWLFGSRAA